MNILGDLDMGSRTIRFIVVHSDNFQMLENQLQEFAEVKDGMWETDRSNADILSRVFANFDYVVALQKNQMRMF